MIKISFIKTVLFMCVMAIFLGCGADRVTQLNNPNLQHLQSATPTTEAQNVLNGPVEGAREWIDASLNQDGNRFLKHTCLVQRATAGDAATVFETLMGLGQLLVGRGQIEGDISDLKFEILTSSVTEAYVRAQGEVRVAVGLSAQARQIDETWHMVYENDTWRWCGSDRNNTLAEPSIPQTQKIIFSNFYDIFSVNADGTQLTNLTNSNSRAVFLDVSPDGKKIAFVQNNRLCVIHIDGSNQLCLTDGTKETGFPLWSFDGKYLAFVEDGGYYTIALDGSSNDKRLVFENISFRSRPRWSPNSYNIALVSEPDSNAEVYVVNVETNEIANLSNSSTYDIDPIWSPDGQQIAFSSSTYRVSMDSSIKFVDTKNKEINYVLSSPTNASASAGPTGYYFQIWSPDGQYLAVASHPDYQLYVLNLSTMQIKLLSIPDVYISKPGAWSPDSKHLATFARSKDHYRLFIINVHDASYTEIPGPTYSGDLKWFLDGKKLLITSYLPDNWSEVYVADIASNALVRVDGSLPVASWDLK